MVKELTGIIHKPEQPVSTDDMHEAVGQHIKGEWIGGSPGFMDEGRGDQQQALRARRFGALAGRVGASPDFAPPLELVTEASWPRARVTCDHVRRVLVATLDSGQTLEAHDPRELAELMHEAGVRAGEVAMLRLHDDEQNGVPTGDQIAIHHRLRQLAAREERTAQLQGVPVQVREGLSSYVRLADIPQPWRDEFRAALRGSACPVIHGEGECARAWDWSNWLQGRFPHY
ncbi:hypothetical protein [Paraburkholderia sp. BL10I2N1]|uniref:hypothetical protein n=1 Tax=Paraburkholderia sp. BL10I2N1 TaxID=1938796 RepID=UPI00105C2199|nr:hypothetical protein [Paraburkholderia sp. BL10I2N1]TDN62429.1 hypothetical protein B0G77_6001 [Paraburkholderia sp. BL10I2N1]